MPFGVMRNKEQTALESSFLQLQRRSRCGLYTSVRFLGSMQVVWLQPTKKSAVLRSNNELQPFMSKKLSCSMHCETWQYCCSLWEQNPVLTSWRSDCTTWTRVSVKYFDASSFPCLYLPSQAITFCCCWILGCLRRTVSCDWVLTRRCERAGAPCAVAWDAGSHMHWVRSLLSWS